jgi:hypothetical protein
MMLQWLFPKMPRKNGHFTPSETWEPTASAIMGLLLAVTWQHGKVGKDILSFCPLKILRNQPYGWSDPLAPLLSDCSVLLFSHRPELTTH